VTKGNLIKVTLQAGRDCSKWGHGRGVKPRATKADLGHGSKLTAANGTDLNGLWTRCLESSCEGGKQGHNVFEVLRTEK